MKRNLKEYNYFIKWISHVVFYILNVWGKTFSLSSLQTYDNPDNNLRFFNPFKNPVYEMVETLFKGFPDKHCKGIKKNQKMPLVDKKKYSKVFRK